MRVFLGNAPWSKPGFYGVRAGSRWPHLEPEGSRYTPFPFFLAYAAAVLENNGFNALIVDAVAERIPMPVFVHKFQKFDPDVVILETSAPSMEEDLNAVLRIREAADEKVRIYLCGANHEITTLEFLSEHPEIDGVLVGEYEMTLLELVQTLENKGDSAKVNGLNFRDSAGQIILNQPRSLIADIDSLPWPSRHQLPMMNYFDEAGGAPQPNVQMWASRGCPFRCIFCVWPQLIYGGHSYRIRKAEAVVDEMQWLVETYGFASVYFDDDTFNIGKERMLTFCNEIKRRNLCIPWSIMARADTMDTEILQAMKEAGLFSVKYGVETADQDILNNSGKNLNLDKVRDTVHVTRDLGIMYHLTFTFGLPGETRITAQKTIELAIDLDPATVQFSICTPMPGSAYYNLLKEKGHLTEKSISEYTGFNSAVVRTDELSATDLETILAEANEHWRNHEWDRLSLRNKTRRVLKSAGQKINRWL